MRHLRTWESVVKYSCSPGRLRWGKEARDRDLDRTMGLFMRNVRRRQNQMAFCVPDAKHGAGERKSLTRALEHWDGGIRRRGKNVAAHRQGSSAMPISDWLTC